MIICILYREHSDAKHSASDTWNGRKRAPEVLTGAEQVFPIATDMRLEASLKQSDSSESCPSQIQHQHKGIHKIAVFRKERTPLHSAEPACSQTKTNDTNSPNLCCDLQRLEKLQHLSADTTVPTSQQLFWSDNNQRYDVKTPNPTRLQPSNFTKSLSLFLANDSSKVPWPDVLFFVFQDLHGFWSQERDVFIVFSVHSILLLKKLVGV